MKINFSGISLPQKGCVVISVADDLNLTGISAKLDQETGGSIKRALSARKFKGKKGEILSIPAPSGTKLDSIFIIGTGGDKDCTDLAAQSIGGKLYDALNQAKVSEAIFVVELNKKNKTFSANIAYGANLRSYRFDKYKTKQKDDDKSSLSQLTIAVEGSDKVEELYRKYEKIAEGVFLTRDVVTEPPNVLYPDSYAEIIKKELTKLGVKVKILDVKQMQKLGMGALLGVGQGSIRESRLVIMEWHGNKKSKEAPIAFVGKGVTFDTGGISLKPAAGMEDMKYDMGGSAVIVGLMKALAGRKANVNAIGVVGLVENMPGHNAQRPSDVVKSMSGQTIEVLNTDAEGRLVLCDALWYCQETFKPQLVIDLATLTGAITIALGEEYAGLFSNNDKLCEKLVRAGEDTDEKLWRFPLGDEYDKLLDSPIADMQNISSGKGAGSIIAAQFLKRFIKDETPWAHLDIAGVTWTKKNKDTCPKGATAFGLRLLDKFIADNYEG